jgi:hypothetical protein
MWLPDILPLMGLKLIGVGLPRTGTKSVKLALEELTSEPCYHMTEVFPRPSHPALWLRVLNGELELLDEILAGFGAVVDWPFAGIWREAIDRFPDVPVLLSRRRDTETWWRSADRTVWASMRSATLESRGEWFHMAMMLSENFASPWDDETAAKAAYEQHNADVRAVVDPARLFEYEPGDGWGPLCDALQLPIPNEPFPHINTTAEFRARQGLD